MFEYPQIEFGKLAEITSDMQTRNYLKQVKYPKDQRLQTIKERYFNK